MSTQNITLMFPPPHHRPEVAALAGAALHPGSQAEPPAPAGSHLLSPPSQRSGLRLHRLRGTDGLCSMVQSMGRSVPAVYSPPGQRCLFKATGRKKR